MRFITHFIAKHLKFYNFQVTASPAVWLDWIQCNCCLYKSFYLIMHAIILILELLIIFTGSHIYTISLCFHVLFSHVFLSYIR